MDVRRAAGAWVEAWQRGWSEHDVDAIASLYAEEALYRALAFREPDRGIAGVRRYLSENFAVEHQLECWFGRPIASEDRAAVEWWGTWVEEGRRLTLAGATVLRFDAEGRVIDHRDYWNEVDRREPPYEGW